MMQSGGGSKEPAYTRYKKQLKPEKDSIQITEPRKIEEIYALVDMSGSMHAVVHRVKQFLSDLRVKYPDIPIILVPFGYNPHLTDDLTLIKYRVQTYEEFLKQNISWCPFKCTNQYGLVEFIKSFTGSTPFGFVFIGDGAFTDDNNYRTQATHFINALTDASMATKLDNCGFLHFIYIETNTIPQPQLEVYLSNSFQTVLRANSNRCIPYSNGFNIADLPFTVSKSIKGWYSVSEFLIDADLFPQTIVGLIDQLGEHRSRFLMVMIEYMIRAMTIDWKLFEIKGSVYSILHRVLSIMKNTKLSDFISNVGEFVSKMTLLWNIPVNADKSKSELTIEDIYTDIIDKWASLRPDKVVVFSAIGKLRKEAFGGDELTKYLKWLNNHTASCKVIINTTCQCINLTPFTPYAALRADFGRQGCGLNPGVNRVEPQANVLRTCSREGQVNQLGKYSMKEFVEFVRNLFLNIVVLRPEDTIPEGYKLLSMVSTIGECRWTALKTLTESIGVMLNTSKTFILGCALHEAISKSDTAQTLYRLSELLNTARFTDPTVAEGVFKVRDPSTGNEYFETSNFSPHVIGLVLQFIEDRGIKFKTMNDVIIPFMKKKQQFEKNKNIIQRIIGLFQIYKLEIVGDNKHPDTGKLFQLNYKKSMDDHVPSIGIIYDRYRFMYLDDHPTSDPSLRVLFNRDCYIAPGGLCILDKGQFVGNFTKFNIYNPDWKTDPTITKINHLLYHEYREKFLKGDYSSNHDEIMEKIMGYMRDRESAITASADIQYTTRVHTLTVIDACQLLSIPASQFAIYNSGNYSIRDIGVDIQPITEYNTRANLRKMGDTTNAPVSVDEFQRIVNIKNPEFPDCVMCECPIVPGYDKLICCTVQGLVANCQYYICHGCQSEQRRTFADSVKKGGRILFNLCTCPVCGDFSNTMYNLVTSSYYGSATRIQEMVKSGKSIYACKSTNSAHCRGLCCMDDIGCAQAGATGIFACDSCSAGEKLILIKCPGCAGYVTHNGQSCNMMRHCLLGEHGCQRYDCPGCGTDTGCCGAKFVLSNEVCKYVPVTITIPGTGRHEITIDELFTMNTAGKIIQFRPT